VGVFGYYREGARLTIINSGMATTPFTDIKTEAGTQDRSYRWYMSAINRLAGNIQNQSSVFRSDIGELKGSLEIGHMYMFLYDPKTKDTLPYWDKFPLCIPYENTKGGWYGLNLHYIPPMLRMQLLGKLLDYTNEGKMDAAWGLLKNTSRFKGVKPCVKRYLVSHVKSRFLKVDPEHWKAAILLPLADFKGATNQEVWSDSRNSL